MYLLVIFELGLRRYYKNLNVACNCGYRLLNSRRHLIFGDLVGEIYKDGELVEIIRLSRF